MAYSGIANVGFALVGVAAGTTAGVNGTLVYMAIYLVMTLGTFACILLMRREGRYVETIADLAGLSRGRPMMALALAILMFSLAGIPPLAGFIGKLYVFKAAIDAGLLWFAVVGVVLSVVGAYYYLRIVKLMYFDEPAEAFDASPSLWRSARSPGFAPRCCCSSSCRSSARRCSPPRPGRGGPGTVTGTRLGHGFRLLELGACRQHQRRRARPRRRRASPRACSSRPRSRPQAAAARPQLAVAAGQPARLADPATPDAPDGRGRHLSLVVALALAEAVDAAVGAAPSSRG